MLAGNRPFGSVESPYLETMSDNMVDNSTSTRVSSLGYTLNPTSRHDDSLHNFDGAHYRDEDVNPITRLKVTQPPHASLQKSSERSIWSWTPSRHPHSRPLKGHAPIPSIIAPRHRPRASLNKFPKGRNVVEQRVRRSDPNFPSTTQKDKVLLSVKGKSRQCKQAAPDLSRTAVKLQLFNNLDLHSAAFSSHLDTAATFREPAGATVVQQSFEAEAMDHKGLGERSSIHETESVHPLSDLSWPFDEALLSWEPTRGYRGGDGSQPSTTGSHGFPGFVTAGPSSSLFGYEWEGPVSQLFWA